MTASLALYRREPWYSCCPTPGAGDGVCSRCGRAVLARPLPPAHLILCDPCFDLVKHSAVEEAP